MTRKFKTLGVALFAVLALTAVSASAASAANYTASAYPTTGTGESALGNDVFTTEAGKVECKAHFQGTLAGASEELTIKPTYTNCKAFGFLEATVNTGGCHLLLTNPTSTVPGWHAKSGHWKCTTKAESTTITAGTCKVTIGEQTLGGTLNITNNAGGDVSVQANFSGIAYTVVTDGFGCPFSGTGAKTGATYVQGNPVTFDSTNGATIDVG